MLAVIRIRGETGIRPQAQKTTELLRLHKINHLVLVEDNDNFRAMLQTAKDYLTWGEVDEHTVEALLENRALLRGRKPLSEENLSEISGYKTYKTLAKALVTGKKKFSDIENIVPVIRLNPPKGGYEAIRKNFLQGGSAGYRGKEINNLIMRMIKPGVDMNGKDQN
ncbi:MAG: 50S ribosomal protein L30 [Thermoplasmataceae archaeon]|jgi:large subunit ribosomal protein L30